MFMFKKLKNKLTGWIKKVSEEAPETSKKEIVEEKPKETEKGKRVEIQKKAGKKEKKLSKNDRKKLKKNKKKKQQQKEKTFKEISEKELDEKLKKEVKKQEYQEPIQKFNAGAQKYEPDLEKLKEPEVISDKKSRTSFFKKITTGTKTISDKDFGNYAEELELILLENNVAIEVVEKIIKELKKEIVGADLKKKEIEEKIKESLKEIISEILIEPFNLISEIKKKKNITPYVILFCGINGTGKTTTIAKLTHLLKKEKLNSVIAAADTFRAASIEQLKKHGEKLTTKVIAHNYGNDPAAVGFDAIKYAQKNNIPVVLIDTAGRMHTAKNLLSEIEKIKRVCKPDLTIFIGESITGNDATEQVKAFNESIGIDAIILSKADIDEKGGTALSVGYTTNKPILFLGIGQNHVDLEPFNKKKFIEKLGL